jgi:hypothetical protein
MVQIDLYVVLLLGWRFMVLRQIENPNGVRLLKALNSDSLCLK